MKILSRVLIAFLFFLFVAVSPSLAQTKTSQAANYPAPNTNSDVPNNLHNWTQTVMIEVMSSLSCQISGVDPINPKKPCLGADTKTGKIGFLPSPQSGGAIGFMGNMLTALYTPPLHTADYFQNLAKNFGITKHAFAAPNTGMGFDSLSPLLGIWAAFRNIVYLILVIVFVIIGLAIMLRVKIDPRTVMSIQNSIPKIIVGILAVTFSFAIAGFLIDLMWILSYLFINVIVQTDPKIASDVSKIIQSTDPFQVAGNSFSIGSILGHSSGAVANITGNLFDNSVGRIIMGIIFAGIGGFLGHLIPNAIPIAGPLLFLKPIMLALSNMGNLSTVLTAGGAAVFGLGAGALAPLIGQGLGWAIGFIIISTALLIGLVRLWFTLLMAYVQILLAVVLVPFWIIGGIIPGSPISIGGWFRNIGANLLAFPVVIAMFLLGKVFIDVFGETQTTGQFVPPLIGNPVSNGTIGSLIALGIILMTPNVVNMLKAALKAPKTETGFGAAIGAGYQIPARSLKGAVATYGAAVYNPLTGMKYGIEKDSHGNPVNVGEEGRSGRIFTSIINRFR